MELEKLFNYSNFIKDNKELINNFSHVDFNKNSIIRYFNKNITEYFDIKSKNYEKFQKLKNEIIILIFISHYNGINDHLISTRLWSLIMKRYLSRIFHHYLSQEYKLYKKNFFILSLGKLGVSDLNYSSDIDLIIFFNSNNKEVSFQNFNKSIKNIFSKISNISPSFFHKIDMRLRPDFGNESIISDIDNSIEYYSSVGRNWERLAFHRSSFLCGNYSLFLDFKQSINSFLYRKSFDYYAIDEIKKLFSFSKPNKNLINIKTSLGYIRTCENILHFLQLLWSGSYLNLRNISIHKLFIILLNYPNIISRDELLYIKKAYYYYRWIEDLLHIKFNSKQNIISFPKPDLFIFDKDIENKLLQHSSRVLLIYNKLFQPEDSKTIYDLSRFNNNSSLIVNNWFDRSNEKISSNQIKKDFDNIIHSFLNTVNELENKDILVIKFDYLLTYYKSGIHLAALYKYNPNILDELIFIFTVSTKLSNQINKYNFLIESLINLSFENLNNLSIKFNNSDDFHIDLKKLINNFYEALFIIDFLYLKKILQLKEYQYQRSRKIRSFIFNLFLLVKNLYLISNNLPSSNIIPVLFGSTALYQNLSYSDTDIFFIKMDSNIDHLDSIKIVKRFYLVINQYLDKSIIDIDHRNKPFGSDSDIIIFYDDFLNFYKSNNDDFYKLSFLKCDIITDNISIKRSFKNQKKNIVSSFNVISKSYLIKIIDIKSKSIDLKSLIMIYDLFINFSIINKLNTSSFLIDLGYLKESLNNQDLIGIKSKIDLKFFFNKIKF